MDASIVSRHRIIWGFMDSVHAHSFKLSIQAETLVNTLSLLRNTYNGPISL